MGTEKVRTAERHGEGLALVAVHGLAVDHRMMTPLLEPLFEGDAELHGQVERFYVDLPGHGQAAEEDVDHAAEAADALDAWVEEELAGRPFVVVAQSLGGLLARELVRRRPEQALGLALIAPRVHSGEEEPTVPEQTVVEKDEELLADLPEKERKIFTAMSVVQTREQYRLFAEEHLPGVVAADDESMAALREHTDLGHGVDRETWRRPVLIVCGRQDHRVGWRDQVELLQHYPHATYTVLDRAGHNVHLERAAVVRALLSDWVQDCLRAATGAP